MARFSKSHDSAAELQEGEDIALAAAAYDKDKR